MLEQRAPDDVDAGKVAGNLTTVLARADARLAELRTTTKQINALLGDEQLIDDVRQTVREARRLTGEARKVVGSADRRLEELTGRYVAVADDLSGLLTTLREIAGNVNAGEGTLGRLVKDPALYQSLTDTADRLMRAIDEVKLLIQKWKAEGVPVQF